MIVAPVNVSVTVVAVETDVTVGAVCVFVEVDVLAVTRQEQILLSADEAKTFRGGGQAGVDVAVRFSLGTTEASHVPVMVVPELMVTVSV